MHILYREVIKIQMLFSGTQKRKYRLIYYLYYNQGTSLSIRALGEMLQVSKKTILADLMEIGKKNYIISSKVAITIKIDQGNVNFKFSKRASIFVIRQYFIEQSITFKLLNVFYQERSLKLTEFSVTNYYSLSVVYKKINELKLKLKPYGLEIKSESGRLFLIGPEEKKRYFYGELYYYVFGDRNSFLYREKKLAENYLKKIDPKNDIFQKKKKLKLLILIAISFQRMNQFPLSKTTTDGLVLNRIIENSGQLFLENNYPQFSEVQLKIEHNWILHCINDELCPYISTVEKEPFLEALNTIVTIFKFKLESQEGKDFTQLMLTYYKEKTNFGGSALLSCEFMLNESVLDISSNIFLQVLINENRKKKLEDSLYPLTLEECATILKITGVRVQKFKLGFISEYPEEWEHFLYRKILTLEIDHFYEWSEDVSAMDIVLSDNLYSFIGNKKNILISPCPSEQEIKKIQQELIMYINKKCSN